LGSHDIVHHRVKRNDSQRPISNYSTPSHVFRRGCHQQTPLLLANPLLGFGVLASSLSTVGSKEKTHKDHLGMSGMSPTSTSTSSVPLPHAESETKPNHAVLANISVTKKKRAFPWFLSPCGVLGDEVLDLRDVAFVASAELGCPVHQSIVLPNCESSSKKLARVIPSC